MCSLGVEEGGVLGDGEVLEGRSDRRRGWTRRSRDQGSARGQIESELGSIREHLEEDGAHRKATAEKAGRPVEEEEGRKGRERERSAWIPSELSIRSPSNQGRWEKQAK